MIENQPDQIVTMQNDEMAEVPAEFCTIFNIATPAEAVYLYRIFKMWESKNMSAVYKTFARDLEEQKNKARQSVEASPIQFPNGCKGKVYSCAFHVPEAVKDFKLTGLSELGLRYQKHITEPNLWILLGIPQQAGEFYITLDYTWENWGPPLSTYSTQLKLIINPDPRDLWKNIATDPTIEYFKEDYANSIQKNDYNIMLAASVRGRSHAHKGLPRDDDFLLNWDENTNWYILAVADGAGSSKFSRRGSALAVAEATAACRRILSESHELESLIADFKAETDCNELMTATKKAVYKILPQAALEAYKTIREEAQSKMRDPKEYATTLLLAIAKKFADNWVVISFQVGDGAMAVIYENDGNLEAKLLAEPDEGEFGGQTRFITMQDIYEYDNLMKRIDINVIKNFKALLLMTDGVSDPKFTSSAELHDSQKWLELWQELKQIIYGDDAPNKLLKWLEFWSPGNHDDRTIAILA